MALLAWQGPGKGSTEAPQALAQAAVGGETSGPHTRLLLCPLVHRQLRQQPASPVGDGCSGCLSLLPARVPLPGFLLLQGLIKSKPLHKNNKNTKYTILTLRTH